MWTRLVSAAVMAVALLSTMLPAQAAGPPRDRAGDGMAVQGGNTTTVSEPYSSYRMA